MQRKEQLLSQLDNALRRKVQQRYMKTTKTQEGESLHQEFYGVEIERSKVNSKLDTRSPYTTKSPVNAQKQIINNSKTQHNVNLKLSSTNQAIRSPQIKSDRESESHLPSNASIDPSEDAAHSRQEIKKLKGRNLMLERELKELKNNIVELQSQSKSLKREESEYLSLKQENASLIKEISFLRAKSNQSKSPRQAVSMNSGGMQQMLKKIMLQLNISALHKYDSSYKFIAQSLKNIQQGVTRLSEEKNKLVTKMNNFDIETLLIKQNNTVYKKQLEVLRNQNQQLQILIEQNCAKIQELQQSVQIEMTEKRQVQKQLKDTIKELDALKRQFRMTIQASKHSKPKRQYSMKQSKQIPIQLSAVSVVNKFIQQQSQTDDIPVNKQQLNRQEYINKLIQQKQIRFQQQIEQLNKKMEQLSDNNFKSQLHITKLEQQIHKYECYIRELQYRSQEIKKDLDSFMPQLKKMEQENSQLRQEGLFRDQLIDEKQSLLKKTKASLQALNDKYENASLQLKKEIFEKELLQTEMTNARSQIFFFQNKISTLEQTLKEKQNEFRETFASHLQQNESQQSNMVKQYKKIISQKEKQINNITHSSNNKERELLQQKSKLEATKHFSDKLQQNITEWQSKLSKFKQAARKKMEELQHSLTKTQQQLHLYKGKQQQGEMIFKRLQQNSQNWSQSYALLENDFNLVQQKRVKQEQGRQTLLLKIDEMSRQLFGYKCDIQRLSFDNKNNLQLKEYYQQASNDLKAKLEQLIGQITKVENEKCQLLEKKTMAESHLQHFETKQAQIRGDWELKERQCDQLKRELHKLANEYQMLSQEYIRYRQESSAAERERLQQITMQNYDIQRLMRQTHQMRTRIEQLSSLRESNLYKSSQTDQKLTFLAEENRSLFIRNKQLEEELRMRQATIDEDLYLNQLKNRQYCILLRKLLCELININELQQCDKFEQLLQRGVEMATNRNHHEHAVNLPKLHTHGQYGLDYVGQPHKRIYIGTQISSSEELTCGRINETDQVLQMQSNIRKDKQEFNFQSPRSFKFSLSPHDQEHREKRTSRLITVLHHDSEKRSKMGEKQAFY